MTERSRHAYRQIARLLPEGFRRAAGRDLEDAAMACLDRERARFGVIGVAAAWIRIVADTMTSALALRRRPRPAFVPSGIDPDRLVAVQGLSEGLMDNFRKDVRYAIRSLRRQPAFTTIVVLTLALGIGANTAVFSVLNGVVLRPLGYPHPEQLEFITSQFPNLGFEQFWVSLPEFVEYRENNHVFTMVGAYRSDEVNLGVDPPARVVDGLVTPEVMDVLGVKPQAGRWFEAADSIPHAEPVVILSWELWQRSFGGDSSLVGKQITVNNTSQRVVGIMPRGFDLHDQKIEIWRPLTIDPSTFPNS